MKKVLIITYYWVPSGGSGVQRWLKFVKYLREFGWEPVVYTVENGEYPVLDPSLAKDVPEGIEVIRQPIWEPYHLYKAFIGQKQDERVVSAFLTENKKPSLTSKISAFIRGNFFIPDARMFWIRPSARFLIDYLQKNPVDAIVSNGPPHSVHLIALKIKEKLNLPWLADFRDPWTEMDFFEDLHVTQPAFAYHRRLEKKVLQKADIVSVVGNLRKTGFERIYQRPYEVITNGYDTEDVPAITPQRTDTNFVITHVGLMNKDRNIPVFWESIAELIAENEDFAHKVRIKLVGKCDSVVKESVRQNNLDKFVEWVDYVPHKEVMNLELLSDVLYLPVNRVFNAEVHIPAKVFEYMAVKKPILVHAPLHGDIPKIVAEAKAGLSVDYDDKEGTKAALLHFFGLFQQGRLQAEPEGIAQFSRRNLTGKMAACLDRLV